MLSLRWKYIKVRGALLAAGNLKTMFSYPGLHALASMRCHKHDLFCPRLLISHTVTVVCTQERGRHFYVAYFHWLVQWLLLGFWGKVIEWTKCEKAQSLRAWTLKGIVNLFWPLKTVHTQNGLSCVSVAPSVWSLAAECCDKIFHCGSHKEHRNEVNVVLL